MKKVLFIIFISYSIIALSSCSSNPTITCKFAKYVSNEELLKYEFIKQFNKDIYTLTFKEDTLPYLICTDSLFKIDLGSDLFCMYYNNSLQKNTGYVIWGDFQGGKMHILTFNHILSIDAFVAHDYNILRVEEDIISFGAPRTVKTNYLLLSNSNDTVKELTLLANSYSLLDTSKVLLAEEFCFPQILVHGVIDTLSVKFAITITGDFAISSNDCPKIWNLQPIVETKQIIPKVYNY